MKKKAKGGVPPLIPFLVMVSVIFIGILVYAYVEAKRANPQMIEVGNLAGETACPTNHA